MKRTSISLLFAAGLLLSVVPALAAERVSSLPETTPYSSGRTDYVYARNKQVLQYGQEEFTRDAIRAVYVDVASNIRTEAITVGGATYYREGSAARWTSRATTAEDPQAGGPLTLAIAPEGGDIVHLIGDAMVGDIPTTQYQIAPPASELAEGLTSYAQDIFIGKNDGYVHKIQFTFRGNYGPGPVEEEIIIVISGHNQPISITAPPSDIVDPQTMPIEPYVFAPGGSMAMLGIR